MTENNLIHETSPYLLQHAHNPVHWYAWNEESLKKAKDENKPIFLSVGYSACHWCHVMAHESFENNDIAEFMNEHFVNIKVDREERPDIDDIYQKVCQIATGQGGWPLSIFLTPDQKPFYVGTYFPVLDSYGRPGFGSITRQLAQAWKEKPKDIEKSADNFLVALQKTETVKIPSKLERTILDEAAMNLFQLGDSTYGGFGGAPKFPNAANVSFLFRYAKLTGLSKFNEFALKTLNKMAKGGIFDQIGGGFHRYSTDAKWLVPHFEKMLYDNALIPVNYAEAYQITQDPFYLEVLCKTLDFVLREMTSDKGGFFSAYDADSEGIEGKFYVWKKSEIKEILGNDADLFCLYYDVTDGGNWEGNSILCNNINISAVAFHFG
ncbi:MAG: thioredoxin domain-containing protein, partial [Nitrosarchaeum sp.]